MTKGPKTPSSPGTRDPGPGTSPSSPGTRDPRPETPSFPPGTRDQGPGTSSGPGTIQIISASAGSGKTHRLAEELDEALVSGQARPEAVLATTFTVKAAAELRQRARSSLLAEGRTVDAQRLEAARIGTVNSVCGRLISDFAFELGLSPRLRVMGEEVAQQELRRALATAATKEDRRDLAAIQERFWELDWRDAVQNVVDAARANLVSADELRRCAHRSWASFRPLLDEPAEDGDALDRDLRRALEEFLRQVDRELDATKTTAKALEKAETGLQSLRAGHLKWKDWVNLANLVPGKKSDELAEPVRRAAAAHDRHPRLHADAETAIRLVFEIAARGLEAYDAHKKAWGFVDFVDQEVKALELLRRPEARERLRGHLDLVLVDEFQDTSPIQLALFLQLAAIARRSVWVGDQKQAIYGFRGTDPALMDAAIDHILGGTEPETLERSWRSRPELVDVTSHLFGRAFAPHGIPPSRVHLAAQRAPDPRLGPAMELWRLAAKNKAEDAAALAAAVRALLADPEARVAERVSNEPRPLRPADVAVLCRRNATSAAVAAELQALGVRAVIPRAGLLATPEGRLALAALRLWVDPADALAAAEIGRLLDYPDDPDGWLAAALAEPGARAFQRSAAFTALLAARQAQPSAGPLAALGVALEAVAAREACLAWGDAEPRLANLEALRAHAVCYVEACELQEAGCTTAGLLAFLGDLASDGADAQATLAAEDAAVVSTWHGAKGLEWPVTILFELGGDYPASALGVRVASDRDRFDLADPLAGRWIRYWPNPFYSTQRHMGFRRRLDEHEASARVRAIGEREDLRLLYVGWTRARDRLVLAHRRRCLDNGILARLRDADGPLLEDPPPGSERALWAGRPVELRCQEIAPQEPELSAPLPGEGYLAAGPREHPPAFLAPSSVQETGELGEVVRLGPRLPLSGDPDDRALGDAFHRFFAVDRPDLAPEDRRDLAAGLLDRWGVAGCLEPDHFLQAADALRQWIDTRWPDATWHRELPVHHRLEGGILVRGSADLVLEADRHLALVDHKAFPGATAQATDKAVSFAGQLRAYAGALHATHPGRPVQCWIHLPISGLLVEIRQGRP